MRSKWGNFDAGEAPGGAVRGALFGLAALAFAACGGARVAAPPSEQPVAAEEPSAEGSESNGGPSAAEPGGSSTELGEAEESDDKDELDDGAETPPSPLAGQTYPHPLDGWTPAQIEAELAKNPERLGSMSIGRTNLGALFNGVQMPAADGWELVDSGHAWGTRETIEFLSHCLEKVGRQLPGGAKMYIGHVSGRRGGHLSPHISHQAGRDVDVSYYYLPGQDRWYATATAVNLDRQRTWAFVKTLVTDTDVELLLIDRSVQRLLRSYALEQREDRAWVDQLFDGSASLPPLIRHAKGHATHLHVRFYNPIAQETGRRAYDALLKQRIVEPPSYFVRHRVKEGETLGHLARRYHVSAKAIQQANGMKSDLVRASHDYRIPQRGGVRASPRAIIPVRRLPPGQTG